VLGQRSDGYHLLDSLVMFANVGDVVRVESGPKLALEITGPFANDLAAADPETNLVIRAARALASLGGIQPTATITLEKNLPVAAGVGGGSSDAAAALHALKVLWGLDTSHADLAALGLEIGADVPACLAGQTLYMAGAGKQIDLAPSMPTLSLVLVGPNAPLSTAQVFKAFNAKWSNPGRLAPTDATVDFVQELASRHNDLQAPAMALQPTIGEALGALAAGQGCLLARMSGSGVVCFGIFGSLGAAEVAAASIARQQPNWWVVATETIGAQGTQ
jgi:4-diphosphocytidyl-2-C-methyl-D-erythritol kinase